MKKVGKEKDRGSRERKGLRESGKKRIKKVRKKEEVKGKEGSYIII